MTHSYPPPIRLSQAFENDRGGGGVTRRTFIKRSGGATVATALAWNAMTHNARATEGSNSGSSFMCAISPIFVDGGQTDANLVGHTNLIGGGYIYLGYTDNACAVENDAHHHVNSINSLAQIYAKAWIPAKSNSTDWVLTPMTLSDFEENSFKFGQNGIERTNRALIDLAISSRDVTNDLSSGGPLIFKLEIVSVNRTNQSVEIFAKAWLEGTAGGETYDIATSSVAGSGLSMVVKNPQADHANDNCDVAV